VSAGGNFNASFALLERTFPIGKGFARSKTEALKGGEALKKLLWFGALEIGDF